MLESVHLTQHRGIVNLVKLDDDVTKVNPLVAGSRI